MALYICYLGMAPNGWIDQQMDKNPYSCIRDTIKSTSNIFRIVFTSQALLLKRDN